MRLAGPPLAEEPEVWTEDELPPGDQVVVRWRDGSISSMRFGHALLAGRDARRLATATADAINDFPTTIDPATRQLIDQLDPDQVRRELEELVGRIEKARIV